MKISPKKIAIVYSGAKHWGGIETYLELLFANVDKTTVDLTLVSLGEWDLTDKLQITNFKLQILSANRINPTTAFRLSSYLRKGDFDLVVSQGTVANGYARMASLLSGVPGLVVVHSDPRYDYSNALVRFVYTVVERMTRFQTKHYIAVSEYLKGKLVKTGIFTDKITVIYNGVPNNFSNGSEKLGTVSSHSHSNNKIVIGSIGRLHGVKNYAELIRACSELKIDNWKLEIAGEGSERIALERLISDMGLAVRVELLGNVENVHKLFPRWDIYIQPSLSEGFGLTVVEAMLAGKPVIVSPGGALPELVKNGETGLVMAGTEHGDMSGAITYLLQDGEKSNRLALAGQTYAREHFGLEKWVRGTEDAFLEAAK